MSTPLGSSQWMYSSGEEVTQQSLKFNDDESQYLSWTPAAAGNRKTWTWSGWVKRGNIGLERGIFSVGASAASFALFFHSSDQLRVWVNGGNAACYTNAVYRDPSAWYHIVLKSSNVSPYFNLYVNGEEITSFAYDNRTTYPSTNDTEVNSVDTHRLGGWYNGGIQTFDGYLSDINFIDGQALDPTSFGQFTNGYWEKKNYAGSYGTNGFHLTFADDVVSEGFNTVTYRGTGTSQSVSGLGLSPDLVWIKDRDYTGLGNIIFDSVRGAGKFLFSSDTSAEGSGSGILDSFDADGFTIGSNGHVNNSGDGFVAWAWDAGANNAPTGHSSVTYTGTGSTQSIKGFGFEPDLVWTKGRTVAGEDHYLFDTVRGAGKGLFSTSTSAEFNYGTGTTSPNISFDSDGVTVGSGGTNTSGRSYIAWGWDAGNGSPVSNTDGSITSTVKASQANGFSIGTFTKGSGTETFGHGLTSAPELLILKRRDSTGSWFSYSSVTGADKWIRLNGTDAATTDSTFWNNTAPTSSVATISTAYNSGEQLVFYAWHSVAGYSSIGSYTGNGSTSGPTITTGFRPGFILVKRTDSSGFSWVIWDGTRNPLGDFDDFLQAQDTAAEANNGTTKVTPSSTGFQVTGTHTSVNASGGTYIYMAFKGSYSDYVSDVNTDGTIDSRVKANPSYGFSVASYVGTGSAATIGHGLSSAPDMVIVKSRDDGYNWGVYHSGLTSADYALQLNTTIAQSNTWDYWNDTAPTSSVFSVGTELGSNKSGSNYIAYCFNSVAGYSSIGSFTGTGAAGNAVNCGFRPAFIMIKKTDSAADWWIFDTTRDTNNQIDSVLYANLSNAEYTDTTSIFDFEITSNGFVNNSTHSTVNGSGASYIYMAFADTREAAFWKDVSGQGNHWQPNNLDYRDSLIDSPANNFATFNAVDGNATSYSEGNLRFVGDTGGSYWRGGISTFGVDSGKWYWEMYAIDGEWANVGIVPSADQRGSITTTTNIDYLLNARRYIKDGTKSIGTGSNRTTSAYGASWTTGDIISVALDMDAGTIVFYKNGSSQGTAFTGISGVQHPHATGINSGSTIANFGQDSTFAGNRVAGGNQDANGIGDFAYAPPSGFLALCTANLPTPTIIDGSTAFNTVLYSGTGATQSITGVGFQPDFVWGKLRSTTSFHRLHDVVRGSDNTLASNDTGAEISGNGIVSFDSDGWTMDSGTNINQTFSYAAWAWKAGGTAVSNTDGSITSQVSANTNAGFSIVSYTGTGSSTTTGHGLNSAPELVIIKDRDSAQDWNVYHVDVGTTNILSLNSTSAAYADGAAMINSTAPTSSVVHLGFGGASNGSGRDYIAYCFHSVEGFSKAGSFTGNGSTDGTFVYTGFRPAWIMTKRTDSTGEWWISDTVRNTYNPLTSFLWSQSSGAEASSSSYAHDNLSNGFKLRTTYADRNASGATFIYLAFAENPFKYANAR